MDLGNKAGDLASSAEVGPETESAETIRKGERRYDRYDFNYLVDTTRLRSKIK